MTAPNNTTIQINRFSAEPGMSPGSACLCFHSNQTAIGERMPNLRLRHHNNCPRCPVIGAEDITGEEFYEILSLRFSIRVARELSSGHDLLRVEPIVLAKWLEHVRLLDSHINHIPLNSGHGVMVTLPASCGMPLIDGNHRAARALREQVPFFTVVLDEMETLRLLRRSMGAPIADHYWKRLKASIPHPNDQGDMER